MPPPAAKEKSIGEERVVNFTGAGLALGEELDVDPATGAWAQGLPEDADKPQALAGGRLRVSASPRLRVSASPRLRVYSHHVCNPASVNSSVLYSSVFEKAVHIHQ